MTSCKKTLFVIGQHGSFEYVISLLRLLIKKYGVDAFRLSISPHLSIDIEKRLSTSIELLEWRDCNYAGLDGLKKKWCFENVFVSSTYQEEERNTILFAKKNKLKSFQLIDMTYDLKKRIIQTNGKNNYPDCIVLVDSNTKKQAINEGLNEKLLHVIGHPQWEKIRVMSLQDIGRVMFVSQPIKNDVGNELGYTEKDAFELVYSIFKKQSKIHHLSWAKHPRENIPEYILEKKDIEVLENAGDGLKKAGTVVGLYSSFLVNAALASKNVINIDLSANVRKKLSLSRMGYIKTAHNENEFLTIFDSRNKDISEYKAELQGSLARLEELLN